MKIPGSVPHPVIRNTRLLVPKVTGQPRLSPSSDGFAGLSFLGERTQVLTLVGDSTPVAWLHKANFNSGYLAEGSGGTMKAEHR